MSIFLGSKALTQAYIGDTPVNAIYQGATLIWERVQDVIVMLTGTTAGYGRTEHADRVEYTIDVPTWANTVDMVLLGAGAHGEDGVRGIVSGYRPGGKAGSWTVASSAISGGGTGTVAVARGTSQYPPPTTVTIGGRATTAASGDGVAEFTSGDTPVPKSRDEFGVTHTAGNGGAREQPGESPGGGGGGGWLSGPFGTPRPGHPGGDGYVWLRFSRVAPLVVGVQIGYAAYRPLREWAESIGETYETITEVTVPLVIVGPALTQLFDRCYSLTSVPQMDTSQVTNMHGMFWWCSSLTTVPPMDTSQVTNMYAMFYGCSSLTTVPPMDTSRVENFHNAFRETAITTAPNVSLNSATTLRSAFENCTSLRTATLGSAPNMADMWATFLGCTSLTSVSMSGLGNVTRINDMVKNCGALTSLQLDGLGPSLENGQTLNLTDTRLNKENAERLMRSLGRVVEGQAYVDFPSALRNSGTDWSIAQDKGWYVLIAD